MNCGLIERHSFAIKLHHLGMTPVIMSSRPMTEGKFSLTLLTKIYCLKEMSVLVSRACVNRILNYLVITKCLDSGTIKGDMVI